MNRSGFSERGFVEPPGYRWFIEHGVGAAELIEHQEVEPSEIRFWPVRVSSLLTRSMTLKKRSRAALRIRPHSDAADIGLQWR